MIHSMTGYGKFQGQIEHKKISIEIKALNGKNLDLMIRHPQVYKEIELDMRKMLSAELNRGKVEVFIHVENNSGQSATNINKALVQSYMEQLADIVSTDEQSALQIAMRLPDVMQSSREEIDEAEKNFVLAGLEKAAKHLNEFRGQEGAALAEDFIFRIEAISSSLEEVEKIDVVRKEEIRSRLEKAVAEIKESVDENRFEQELIYYLEKYDITEEKVRLRNHLSYFMETLNNNQSSGKKLGFIAQEIGREINTIGSKSYHAALQKVVVIMKDDLEKIKEQLLNVL
ncbi:MAG: YicC family protein [Flavobacteriaceae bacterium]|nr:YicC family protein [Flavobacteriaceae bacterium]